MRSPSGEQGDDTNPVLVVCGPTACGKSALADDLADELSDGVVGGVAGTPSKHVPVVVVDSMQVYRGVREITNQPRRRFAELVGAVPLGEHWTVARHRAATDAVLARFRGETVLDAGTGMYLNAILLDVDLAPEVPPGVRERAGREIVGAPNPRRAARQRELEMVGAPQRRSIWGGDLRGSTSLVYLRPERHLLDAAIARRSRRIVSKGLGEANRIGEMRRRGEHVNPSVLESIGVRELLDHLEGTITKDEATVRISARTRRLARRQIRWFDKLARTLHGRAGITVAQTLSDPRISHTMHGILRA